ncbi:MAG: hypothetical protein WC278_00610 [Bacilli bacterium]|jgi:guanylate kinase|nr:hypothetical protein [Bacilli bacterium]MDD3121710.1 hypothetical protein [Bacilli bacterium]MDD4063526.1 hypothetical protein [Bacilli bacterium]MDD4482455.1 hypothetical protein [Bacilli bacterium]MDY0364155.1 hypothetical protein [Bacilli bacterium]
MLVLIGPSASGKTEIAHYLIKKYKMKRVVTCTTRKKRVGEEDGVDYYFLTFEEFNDKIANNEFLEYTLYNKNYYGTLKKEVSKEKILIIEANGFYSLKKIIPKQMTSFFLRAPTDERLKRMIRRGDLLDNIDKKKAYDDDNFPSEIIGVDYIINNFEQSIDKSAEEIYELYNKE